LAHNKSLLKYLYDAIEHRNIASVGYYIGGMKEAALKKSETKKIIIVTYSMAAEALDIKSLTTLVMATPKTDIEQSVGRILREKHNQPVVVDIIDSHDLFQNQWNKRKAFYKKQNYKIIHTTSQAYDKNTDTWDTMVQPKCGLSSSITEAKKFISKVKDVDALLQGKCLLAKPPKNLI
jgi:superfamily II DNA or RNA helicase